MLKVLQEILKDFDIIAKYILKSQTMETLIYKNTKVLQSFFLSWQSIVILCAKLEKKAKYIAISSRDCNKYYKFTKYCNEKYKI